MSGYQFRKNILEFTYQVEAPRRDLRVLRDTRKLYDRYMVADSLPPGSELWDRSLIVPGMLPKICAIVKDSTFRALKEILVLMTPAGGFAFLGGVLVLIRRKGIHSREARYLTMIILSGVSLVAGYSLFRFDPRHAFPLIPLFMAVASGALFSRRSPEDPPWLRPSLQRAFLILTLAGLIFFMMYWASPFRRFSADYQQSCYDAAQKLNFPLPGQEGIVAIGEGPYPELGVGWESGIYAAYFANTQVIGFLAPLTQNQPIEGIIQDIRQLKPGAVLVYGNQKQSAYEELIREVEKVDQVRPSQKIWDPRVGEVGKIFYIANSSL
jgi:hypothetical protein